MVIMKIIHVSFFSVVFDLAEVNAENFIKAITEAAGLSPFRYHKEIIIESVSRL